MDNKLLTGIGILGIIYIVLMSGCISEEKDLSEMTDEEIEKLSEEELSKKIEKEQDEKEKTEVIQAKTHDVEYLELSASDLLRTLQDRELTGLQREEIWNKYKGRKVMWIAKFEDVKSVKEYSGYDKWIRKFNNEDFIATFKVGWGTVRVAFPKTQKQDLLKLSKGDLIIYTGTLDNFERSWVGVKGGSIVLSEVLVSIWSKNIRYAMEAILADNTIYVIELNSSNFGREKQYQLYALNTETGKVIWNTAINKGEMRHHNSLLTTPQILGLDANFIYIMYLHNRRFAGDNHQVTIQVVDLKTGEIIQSKIERYENPPSSKPDASDALNVLKKKGIEITPIHDWSEREKWGNVLFTNAGYKINSDTEEVLWINEWPSNIKAIRLGNFLYKDLLCIYGGGIRCSKLQELH